LELSDESGRVLCNDMSEHGGLICRFRPGQADLVTASVTNPSLTEVTVLMISNHPIENELPDNVRRIVQPESG
ncbi:MAG: hypothetical protein HKN32_09815, partial [Flavobacteriales bacterium]|nr:hypothetical protein [Flavobacteriales bacterium]